MKEGYTVDQIKMAIDGCSITPHNNGTDPRGNGQIYDCLELICRSGENIERFVGNATRFATGAMSQAQKVQKISSPNIIEDSSDDDWHLGDQGI